MCRLDTLVTVVDAFNFEIYMNEVDALIELIKKDPSIRFKPTTMSNHKANNLQKKYFELKFTFISNFLKKCLLRFVSAGII